MTTYFEEDFESYDDASGRAGALMNWAGAVVSLALVVGLTVWGYQLLMRDVTGVPVVQALEGPMRVAPDDPGGLRAEFQELTVTRVASDGAEEVPTERVVLAPPPLKLEEEDQPMTALIDDTASAEPALGAGPEDTAEAAPADAAEPQSAIELAIAEALAGTELGTATATPEKPVQIAVGGVHRSPRPFARPDSLEVPVVNAVATSASASGDIDPATIPPGTRLVQLGAFPSVERAREAWDMLDARFSPYFDGKGRVVQEASAGGSTFYRLRVMGFEDLSDARRFCAVLVAENANCIPVIRR